MDHYFIPAGTACHVRGPAAADWRPFVTTRDLRFLTRAVADTGGSWVFAAHGWLLKVNPNRVVGRPKPDQAASGGPPILRSKGRGSSRRRAMKCRTKGKSR